MLEQSKKEDEECEGNKKDTHNQHGHINKGGNNDDVGVF